MYVCRFKEANFIDLFGSDNAKLGANVKTTEESVSFVFSESSATAMFRDLDRNCDGLITSVRTPGYVQQ